MLQRVLEYRQQLLRKKDKIKQVPSFLNRMSTLLDEGYTLPDSILMLLPYHVEDYDYWYSLIQDKLRNGESVIEIFKSFSIPDHYLISIEIAEVNGDLAKTLKMIAQQIDFQEKLRKKLTKLLIYPLFLLVFLVFIFVGFRTYFLPNIEQILNSRNDNKGSTIGVSNFILYFPEIMSITVIFITILIFLFLTLIRKQPIQQQMKLFTTIPIINYFFKLHITKQFSRLIGSLLIGGFSLQQTFEILKGQKLNHYIKFLASEIELKVIYGDSLSNSVLLSGYFFPKFNEFIKHGEKSGYLGREMMIYSDLLDEKLQTHIKTGISFVQPLFFIIIALSIIAAYLSILMPMYNIIEII
ncbi:Competence-related pilin export protein ComGB OS=Ureibacillus acetophenoni OX=614649 GN=SAMN05877842_102158 PE=3 SV=1 [Ureibacillus acetophenoni]